MKALVAWAVGALLVVVWAIGYEEGRTDALRAAPAPVWQEPCAPDAAWVRL